jgi:hypothetical protein
MAYCPPLAPDETSKHLKRRIYNALHILTTNASPPTEMRIVKKFPSTAWNQVWKNLHGCPVSDEIKSTWYKALHELVPTNDRLSAINLIDTAVCSACGRPDSLQHKITECGEGPVIWTWTKKLLAYILRVDHRQIPQSWTTRPDFRHWPPQRQSAVLWIMAHLVQYRLLTQRRLSLQDYADFMRRSRWKLYQHTRRPRPTGRYLDAIDWTQY